MADENPNPTEGAAAPKIVKMHRAVHEVITAPKTAKAEQATIDPGTIITDEVAKEHKLGDKALDALTDSGALELVDVLKG